MQNRTKRFILENLSQTDNKVGHTDKKIEHKD